MNNTNKTWSYSHFMYRLINPFKDELENVEGLLAKTYEEAEILIKNILDNLSALEESMTTNKIKLRPSKIFVHCIDIEYTFPEKYNFIEACRNFVQSSGIIVFDHLDKFEVIKKYLNFYKTALSQTQHPITGDTMWHLNPYTIDIFEPRIWDAYNFRDETPSERRLLAEFLDLPLIRKFPLDENNIWTQETEIYVDVKCREESTRAPLNICKYLHKQV